MTDSGTTLVTGASGFIGQHLVAQLGALQLDVAQMTSRGVICADGRSRDWSGPPTPADIIASIEEVRPARVFHLATHFVGTHMIADIRPLVNANVEFGVAVAEGATRVGATLTYASSAWQRYMGLADSISLYAAMKEAYSRILDYYEGVRALNVREVFLFDTYGPRDRRGKIVSRLMEAARSQAVVRLGSPEKLINLTYVDDVVAGILKVSATSGHGRDFVIREPTSIQLSQLADAVSQAADQPL